jgi:glycine/D-amino acid oxidase-like deaminating enzyme
MRHDAHGYWIAEQPTIEPEPPLQGEVSADVAIVGGGYTGMWTAWWVKALAPEAEVVLCEAGICGHGPSGRNGGFCNSMWFSLPTLVERFGDGPGLEVCRRAAASVDFVGEWCRREGVDAHYRKGGYLQVSAAPAQDGAWERAAAVAERLGAGEVVRVLDPAEVRQRCDSPRFRAGALYPTGATINPARLAAGLRERVIGAGVRIHERTPMRVLHDGPEGVRVETPDGAVGAAHGVLATGGGLLGVPGLRRALTATSSHMVVTEPVPDVLEELNWTGGEAITDSRAMLHYFRTTVDGRIAFGWGGGRIAHGARLEGRAEIDPPMVAAVERHMRSFFPQLEGRSVERAWGGPIDVSPTHLPVIRSPGPRLHAGFGYTGNGVAPSQLVGRTLAAMALDRCDEHTALAIVEPPPVRVPPEPFRYIGGNLIRRAILRKERLEEEGRKVDALTRTVCGIPERIGIHIGR